MRPGDRVLAIDIGTQTVRAALCGLDGTIHDLVSSPVRLYTPGPGLAEQDPGEWWSGTVRNITALLGRTPAVRVAAVGVGAQMHSLVPVDGTGASLADRVGIWSDKRGAAIVERLERDGGAAELRTLAGNVPVPAWAGVKAAWFREQSPDVYRRARVFLVAKDYINLRLTGLARTDPSEASGYWLMDRATGAWSAELAGALGLDTGTLPEIRPSTEVIGGVSRQAADATGLPAGTPVVCGAGDMLCQLAATGLTTHGRVTEISGTAAIIASWAAEPELGGRVMNLRVAGEGWARFGIADAGGVSLRWFADHFCEHLDGDTAARYAKLSDEAELIPPGADGLRFLPTLLGERTLGSPAARGALAGLTPLHRRAHVMRAILEGVCFDLRRSLDEMGVAGGAWRVRVTGGGAASDLWNRIRADVYGLPVERLGAAEGGIVGAALLAAVGIGAHAGMAAAAESVIRVDRVTDPRDETVRRYDDLYGGYRALVDALEPLWATWDRT